LLPAPTRAEYSLRNKIVTLNSDITLLYNGNPTLAAHGELPPEVAEVVGKVGFVRMRMRRFWQHKLFEVAEVVGKVGYVRMRLKRWWQRNLLKFAEVVGMVGRACLGSQRWWATQVV